METEYSSYRLGLTEKRAGWLKSRARNVAAIGRGLSWGRYTPGPHDDTHHAESPLHRLQRPSRPPSKNLGLSFFTDAKAQDGRAWVGGFLEIVPGCQGPWFSLKVDRSWAPLGILQIQPQ